MTTSTKSILKSTTTSRSIPARTIKETRWECTCGIAFDDEESAQIHHGITHAPDRSVEIRGRKCYLLSSQDNFLSWQSYQCHKFGNYYLATENAWDGPGWYCSQLTPRGHSVWDGDHSIIKADVILREWRRESELLEEHIRQAQAEFSTSA